MGAKLKDIGKIISQAFKSKRILDAAGASMTESIVKRTRLGKGVQDNKENPTKLKKLETSTVRRRKQLKKAGQLTGPNATPGKSGLNRTGEMLNDVNYKASRGKLDIFFKTEKSREKAFWVQKNNPDFKFFFVSKPEFNRALKVITKEIQEALSKIKFDGF